MTLLLLLPEGLAVLFMLMAVVDDMGCVLLDADEDDAIVCVLLWRGISARLVVL